MATVIDKDLGYTRIFRDIKELDKRGIKIGFMGNDSVDGVSVVDYATYNEFGTSRIPARPFMQTTADQKREEVLKFSEHLVGKMIDGGISADMVLKNLGEFYQAKIQETIRKAKEWAVPNAPATVARKGSSSPLIDTGRMVNSVRYEIVK